VAWEKGGPSDGIVGQRGSKGVAGGQNRRSEPQFFFQARRKSSLTFPTKRKIACADALKKERFAGREGTHQSKKRKHLCCLEEREGQDLIKRILSRQNRRKRRLNLTTQRRKREYHKGKEGCKDLKERSVNRTRAAYQQHQLQLNARASALRKRGDHDAEDAIAEKE